MFFLMLQEKGLVNKMLKYFNTFKGMTVRNMKVYLKDRMTIVMSMMTQIIILGLFILFIKNNYFEGIKNIVEMFGNVITDNDIESVVNSWLVSGVIGTSVITVALNSLNVMVSDKQKKISYDYGASPVKNSAIVLSYFFGAFINTFIISSIILTAGFIFLCIPNTVNYSFYDIAGMYGFVALGSISATLILMFVVSFFKKTSTLNSFGIIVSAAVGFVIGAYIPVGQFDSNVQTAVNLVPGAQIAGMMRNLLVSPAINNINDALNGADKGAVAEELNSIFAINMNIFDNEIGFNFMLTYSVAVIILFLILNLITYKFSSRTTE